MEALWERSRAARCSVGNSFKANQMRRPRSLQGRRDSSPLSPCVARQPPARGGWHRALHQQRSSFAAPPEGRGEHASAGVKILPAESTAETTRSISRRWGGLWRGATHSVGKSRGFRQASGAGARSWAEAAAQSLGATDDGEKGVRDTKSLGVPFSGSVLLPETKIPFFSKKSSKPC